MFGQTSEEISETRTRASWSVEERKTNCLAGERHGITDDLTCPIPPPILADAIGIVSARFNLDGANLHPIQLEQARIPLNSPGGHRCPGTRGLPSAMGKKEIFLYNGIWFQSIPEPHRIRPYPECTYQTFLRLKYVYYRRSQLMSFSSQCAYGKYFMSTGYASRRLHVSVIPSTNKT